MIVGFKNVVACTFSVMDLFFRWCHTRQENLKYQTSIRHQPKYQILHLHLFSGRSVVYCGVKFGITWCVSQRVKLSHLARPWLSHSGPSGELYFLPRVRNGETVASTDVFTTPLIPGPCQNTRKFRLLSD
jgi:hypothetical protein